MAFRTTAVTTGVIRILLSTAVIAFKNMATNGGSATSEYVLERAAIIVWHSLAELLEVLRAVTYEDVCYFDHGD
jgi:hypothetical protein